jgi:propionyl-CoA carboxylase alpha chain
VTVLSVSPTAVRLEVDGVVTQTRGHMYGSPREIWVDGPLGSARLREIPRFVDPAQALASGSLVAPMPGSVVAVEVADGESVVAGSAMLVLEAMKMQHTISAPTDGVVSDLVRVGAQVAAGDVLAVVSTRSTPRVSETEDA